MLGLCPVLCLEDTGAHRSCTLEDTVGYGEVPVLKAQLLQRCAQGAEVK